MKKTLVIAAAVVIVAVVVIVVNAPPPDSEPGAGGPTLPIATVFTVLEAENDVVRQLWTERIVGDGQEQGMEFDKDWRQSGRDAGPLPAPFLRETAEGLRRNSRPLYLFLGSDFPINDANRFTGAQLVHFEDVKRIGEPQFFLDAEIDMQTAMFSDIAVAETCVECHNSEPETTKSDWRVGDIMGATTWSYPESEVSVAEALDLVGALRHGHRTAYDEYLAKAATFAQPPVVGSRWPVEGYFLPSTDIFMAEAELLASPGTLRVLLGLRGEGE